MESKIPAPPMTYFFVSSFCYQHFIIAILLFCIYFYRSSSVLAIHRKLIQNSFLTSVSPAALLAISISKLSTSAIGSHGKMMVGTEGVKPFPVYRSFSSQIGFNMCFHFQHLLAFGLVSFSSLFLLKAFVKCVISA